MGERFLDAGYVEPKSLIRVDGKPIVEHVVALFPGESNFFFICNARHLQCSNMRQILSSIAPKGRVFEIPTHHKGPVFAVSKILDQINDDEEAIVNYCDFSKYWDYQDFIKHTRNRNADGAISAYKGFHPHMLGTTNYAFIKEDKQWMLEIKEKQPFTDKRMQEYASDGTYYFKKGAYIKKYFKELMEKDISVNGEYYVSMVYNLFKRDNLRVSIYEIQHMLQWGTPEDLEEYVKWSDYFRRTMEPQIDIKPKHKSINLIPMAGRGKRFIDEGYANPKPLIEISGKPMVIQAVCRMPKSEKKIFVCLKEHLEKYVLEQKIKEVYPDAEIKAITTLTSGQARTCEIGLENEDLDSSLLIWSCDNSPLWDKEKYRHLTDNAYTDAIVWSFRHCLSGKRNPCMYGWIKVDNNDNVAGVSVKKTISDNPYNDHAIVGNFYFKKAEYFIRALKNIYKKDIRINNEFYVDSCINELVEMGLTVRVFEVENYVSWGTPDEVRTYEYWQSFFHKCDWHEYAVERDPMLDSDKVDEYIRGSRLFKQKYM